MPAPELAGRMTRATTRVDQAKAGEEAGHVRIGYDYVAVAATVGGTEWGRTAYPEPCGGEQRFIKN